jgi:7-cyano-7-deazaguanine synthase in queuosine biosynthesis
MINKIVVQCSGGVESTTLLALAIEKVGRENTYPIVFKSNSIFWQNRDSTAVKRILTSLQLQTNAWYCDIPDSDYLEYKRDHLFEDVGFIPGYKMIMNINALSFAQRVSANTVWIGNMADNVYPDETPELKSTTN